MRTLRRTAVLVTIAACLVTFVNPSRANATLTGGEKTAIIVSGCVLGGMVVVALVATAIHRYSPPPFTLMPEKPGARREPGESRIHFGLGCPMVDGSVSAVCW